MTTSRGCDWQTDRVPLRCVPPRSTGFPRQTVPSPNRTEALRNMLAIEGAMHITPFSHTPPISTRKIRSDFYFLRGNTFEPGFWLCFIQLSSLGPLAIGKSGSPGGSQVALVPKLRLGTHFSKLCFACCARSGTMALSSQLVPKLRPNRLTASNRVYPGGGHRVARIEQLHHPQFTDAPVRQTEPSARYAHRRRLILWRRPTRQILLASSRRPAYDG